MFKSVIEVMEHIVNLMGKENFENYTLSDNDIGLAISIFIVVLLAIGIVSKSVINEQKKLAWAVSLCNSFIMMNIGAIYLAAKAPSIPGIFYYGKSNNNLERVFHDEPSNFTTLTCLWFALANIFDLMFGCVYYRKYLDPLTGFIHHAVFIWLCFACTTGNGIFFKIRKPFASSFLLCLIEEFPTFLLALGTLFPMFRTNNGFGITFFLLRIVYHTYFMTYAFYLKADTPVLVLFIMTLLLHVKWFQAWMKKYGPFARSKSTIKQSK